MSTPITKNISHRRFIKEKTNQIIDLSKVVSRPLSKKQIPYDKKKSEQNSKDNHSTSFDQRLKEDDENIKLMANGRQAYLFRKKNISQSKEKSNVQKFKSVEAAPTKQLNSYKLKYNFSVRKLKKQSISHDIVSMQNIENKQKKQISYGFKPKSETCLKQTMKKSSSKLKLKVKDPFQKRIKLENQFSGQSVIQKIDVNDQSGMFSTLNQSEFKDLLSQILC